ncbi:Histidine triad nucleotide-binding protein 2, mitochondrial [Portunus trituberculatus]|uniref:Histidine triad nucleotide-binding protein 2, mitochondrial n=1 Tax=Portunus trituberculatus TaxID=210409 RepID=A0A5B7GUQ4_PORTR|nr:Histidine triad nucleotide-binding protein 2, mitochondrial [Portunus trituberculatus]
MPQFGCLSHLTHTQDTMMARCRTVNKAKNSPTIFDRILDGSIKADIVYEDPECLAFRDVDPQAPKHLLIIPRRRIAMLEDAQNTDQMYHITSMRMRAGNHQLSWRTNLRSFLPKLTET